MRGGALSRRVSGPSTRDTTRFGARFRARFGAQRTRTCFAARAAASRTVEAPEEVHAVATCVRRPPRLFVVLLLRESESWASRWGLMYSRCRMPSDLAEFA